MFQPLDGPSKQGQADVTDSTAFRVKVNTVEFEDREVVSIMPLDGKIWVLFADQGETPTAAQIKERGFPQLAGGLRTYEATNTQVIFIVADTGTVDVRFAERG